MPRRRAPNPQPAGYEDNVFLNCPFDEEYRPQFRAVVFAIFDSGFVARCALEVSDASVNRLDRIVAVIHECRYGVHDISRTETGPDGLPRFNMPLELGLFVGAKKFGLDHHRRRACLILDKQKYRYQKFISDIAGQDVVSHGGQQKKSVVAVRDWLKTQSRRRNVPGGDLIWKRYRIFIRQLPVMCEEAGINPDEMPFVDYIAFIEEWLLRNAS